MARSYKRLKVPASEFWVMSDYFIDRLGLDPKSPEAESIRQRELHRQITRKPYNKPPSWFKRMIEKKLRHNDKQILKRDVDLDVDHIDVPHKKADDAHWSWT